MVMPALFFKVKNDIMTENKPISCLVAFNETSQMPVVF
jgi:hypothetical protein